MGEFELIDEIVAQLGDAADSSAVIIGPGDDAAVIAVPDGHHLVTSVDTLVADLHFPREAPAELIAQRAMRISVSDLAAMGAEPLAAVIALVLPQHTCVDWVRGLSQGFAQAAKTLRCPVTGGNLTAGELAISVTVQGVVPAGDAIVRSGARSGDRVWVSGALGGAATALAQGNLAQVDADSLSLDAAQTHYYLPAPQIELGVALRSIATSAIDISDGFAADLGHIAASSGIAIELDEAAIPRFQSATKTAVLHGGDDYMLCFTAPQQYSSAILDIAPDARAVGVCTPWNAQFNSRLFLDGKPLRAAGFDHFSSSSDRG